jgi:hypothetical protein
MAVISTSWETDLAIPIFDVSANEFTATVIVSANEFAGMKKVAANSFAEP